MRRAGCAPEDNARCDQWIKEYAKNLRDMVNGQPEILHAWEASPEKTMKKIEESLAPEGSHDHSL